MLARLSAPEHPALARLSTRDDDDFTIALLDAWATVADVLTFYQERIANERYLRTATERRSVSRAGAADRLRAAAGRRREHLSRLHARRGAGRPGSGHQATAIEVGTRVQSIPGPGEQPQTFETIEKIEARIEWNAMKPRLTRRHPVEADTKAPLFFAGLATGLKPGDGLLLCPTMAETRCSARSRVSTVQSAERRTEVVLDPPPRSNDPPDQSAARRLPPRLPEPASRAVISTAASRLPIFAPKP